MKNLLFWKPLALMVVVGCLFGCGGDDVEDNGSIADSAPDDDNQIPTITIKKLRSEKVEIKKRIGEQRWKEIGARVWWRLNADPAPKTDLPVMGSFGGSRWIIIPKSRNSSEEFSDILFNNRIQIDPLPTVSIVGKGLVVDLEKLQKGLPVESRGGHRIPEEFDFPLYKVAEPSHIASKVEVQPLPPLPPKPPPEPPPEPQVSFAKDIQPILNATCAVAGCHAGGAPKGGLNLETYVNFKKGGNGGAVFKQGNGKGSLIVGRIDGGGMPPGGQPLKQEQIDLFIKWIEAGAKNN